MKWKEFFAQIDRLKNTYGEKLYGDDRVKLMWHSFEKDDARLLQKTIDEIILSNRTGPLLADLKEVARKIKMRESFDEPNWPPENYVDPACRRCLDSTVIFAIHKKDKKRGDYSFHCPCVNDVNYKHKKKYIPVWSKTRENDFDLKQVKKKETHHFDKDAETIAKQNPYPADENWVKPEVAIKSRMIKLRWIGELPNDDAEFLDDFISKTVECSDNGYDELRKQISAEFVEWGKYKGYLTEKGVAELWK